MMLQNYTTHNRIRPGTNIEIAPYTYFKIKCEASGSRPNAAQIVWQRNENEEKPLPSQGKPTDYTIGKVINNKH